MLVVVFERFADRSRRVLVLAQEEARLLNHNFIGTEHLLLGLIQEGEGVAAQVLASLGVTLVAARNKVAETIGPSGASTTAAPPFTPRAKKVLELSLREALQLGHNYIATEHLLLGLVREGEGVGAQVLVSLGAALPQVRVQVIARLAGYDPSASTTPLGEPPEDTVGGWVSSGGRPDGPRCPACRSLLEGHVAYRLLAAQPYERGAASEAIHVVFVYCLHCGVVIAPTSARALGADQPSGVATASAPAANFFPAIDSPRLAGTPHEETIAAHPPVAKVVTRLITEALRDRASDVHLEPTAGELRVRFRIHGVLHDVRSLPIDMAEPLVSRVKTLAHMNIVERRKAQDGQFAMEVDGRSIDIRVSIMATVFGEKCVMRIPDKSRSL